MQRLPFALSIPHGGVETPKELLELVIATPEDQREDIDHLTREIFGVPDGMVAAQIQFSTARTFVDLNRHPDDWGNENADGVVKTHTHMDRPVFSRYPERSTIRSLLDRLYKPYHETLASFVNDPDIVLLLDCHSMAPYGLSVSPDQRGQPRPSINLGHQGGRTASLELVQTLREVMAQVYEVGLDEISIDYPFNGGYISSQHHTSSCAAIQIEFNRAFYLGSEEGKARPVLEPAVIELWRNKFHRCLHLLHERAFSANQLVMRKS